MTTAKIFKSGNSQAIRIPKEYRFAPEMDEVSIRREGDQIILEPLENQEWPEEFWAAFGEMPEDFERPRQIQQLREDLEL
ncbi:MAG: type II toxin-antitoxin system VapB family antitoxin [Thermoanaerobaculales bacterium]|nr:type II toxin-antitoxin system VapB family antitoxin [Thermoanaerobaculales bacterium]